MEAVNDVKYVYEVMNISLAAQAGTTVPPQTNTVM